MTAVPALQEFARLATGEPRAALQRLLELACELLAMDLAFVSVLDGAGNRITRQSAYANGIPGPIGLPEPLDATGRDRVVSHGPMPVENVRESDDLQALPSTPAFSIASWARVPLIDKDGTTFGELCTLGHRAHDSLNSRDRELLISLAEVVAPLVRPRHTLSATLSLTRARRNGACRELARSYRRGRRGCR